MLYKKIVAIQKSPNLNIKVLSYIPKKSNTEPQYPNLPTTVRLAQPSMPNNYSSGWRMKSDVSISNCYFKFFFLKHVDV